MTAQQLKNSILQMAVQGKLVPQDPNDEPASVLLERIKVEKQALIKAGKIKKEKPLAPITEEEIPFEIPASWCWCRLIEIYNFIDYRGSTPNKISSGVPLITAKNVKKGFIDYKIQEFISEDEYKNRQSRGISKIGDILFTTEAPMGNVALADIEKFSAGQRLITLQQYTKNDELSNLLFMFFMLSDCFYAQLLGNCTGTTVKGIKAEKLKKLCLPIPPLSEQKRIVAKIEELMPYIDKYDKAETKLTELNAKFPDALKKSILQEAVQGKLVPQNHDDEPASVLLERIRAEKQSLIKAGKIKKENPLSPITEDEIPFEIPESWCWCRLGDILLKLTDGTHSTPKYTESGTPFISVKDVSSGKLDFSNCKHISNKEHSELYERCNPEYGDILLTKVGTTGIPVIVDTTEQFSLFVSVALLKFSQELLYNKYLIYMINSPLVQKQATENTKGVGNKNWVMRDIANTLIVIPPIEEQHRIVEKIEEIMPFIGNLAK